MYLQQTHAEPPSSHEIADPRRSDGTDIDRADVPVGWWSGPLQKTSSSGLWRERLRSRYVAARPTVYDHDTHPWQAAIQLFGGRVVNPTGFPPTLEGFQSFLDATGVQHFKASEMVTPHRRATAARLGYSILLPPQDWWPRGAALAKLADKLRELVGRPIRMRNWWRPAEYNREVGGAAGSDHIDAMGVDLDYASRSDRRKAENLLEKIRAEHKWLGMSLGLGGATTHVGILTPRGARTWHYKSYSR